MPTRYTDRAIKLGGARDRSFLHGGVSGRSSTGRDRRLPTDPPPDGRGSFERLDMTDVPTRTEAGPNPSFREFVALIAGLMGLTALGIDTILPAFAAIQSDFAIVDGNVLQYLIYGYMIGFAAMQLVYGPMSDVIGRRPTMLIGLAVFVVGGIAAAAAQSYDQLIWARVLQGMGAAAARVLAVSIVRDRFGGRDMARVMSFVIMVFIVVPVFAPAIGGGLLLIGGWRFQFIAVLGLAVALLAWFFLRMPETLHPEYRMPFSMKRIGSGAATVITTRLTFGYSTAMGIMMGCLMGYIGSAQQIFESEVYGLGPWFPLAFGAIACVMGLGSWVNSRLVPRWGMRRLAHGALIGYVVAALAQLALSLAFGGHPPLVLFGLVLAASNFMFALALPNFNAMSMEPMGRIAGTASSLIGFYTTLIGALLGLVVGQQFDGTVTPLGRGFVVFSTVSLAVVFWTEKGRLFTPQHEKIVS